MVSPRRWLRAAAVIGATAMLLASSCTWQLSLFIPEGVPPPAGDPVPPVDTHASGRPADQLRAWARTTVGGVGDSGHRAGGLRVCRPGRRGREPEVPYCVDHAGGHRAGREPPRHLPGRDAGAQRRCESAYPGRPPGRQRRHPAHCRQRGRHDGRRRGGACDGTDAVHSGDMAVVRCRRPQRRPPSAQTTSTMRRLRRRVICVGAERISRHRAGG